MTIILTGTHLTPALATIQALKKKAPEAKLVYVGRKHTGTAESVEKEEIERLGAEFAAIKSGKFHRWLTFRILPEMLKIPAGIWQAFALVRKYKPGVVVSFGGYISVPMVLAGKLGGAKIVIHEQTSVWGAANRLVSFLADVKAVSWQEMAKPGVVWTGNPIREEVIESKGPTLPRQGRTLLDNAYPVLYITGGNQGSKTIDGFIEPILPDLVKKFEVFHQTKSETKFKHPRYHAAKWFSTPIHAEILSKAAVSVSRAGANTVTELIYLGIPSILVPLPDSAGGEQQKNARIMAEAGLGKIIKQQDLSAEKLLGVAEKLQFGGLRGIRGKKKEKKDRISIKADAAEELASLILEIYLNTSKVIKKARPF